MEPSVTTSNGKPETKIYEFKKLNEMPKQASVETNEIESIVPTDKTDASEKTTLNENSYKTSESITKSYTSTEESNEVNLFSSDLSKSTTAAMTSATTNDIEIIIIDREDLAKTVLNSAVTTVFENDITEDVTEHFSTGFDVEVFNHTSPYLTQKIEDDVVTSSYEDYYGSSETIKPTRRVEYSYRQKTLPSSTLLHGFISNPGTYLNFFLFQILLNLSIHSFLLK